MKKEKIREILAESICVDIRNCTDKMNVKYDLGADSLSLLAFGLDIANEFGIDESKIKYNFETVGELIDEINAATNS